MAIRNQRRSREVGVPTDSLSDIGFLLIIFFILTTSIQRVVGFKTDIPSAERAEQTEQSKLPGIKLNQGQLTLDDQPVTPEQLRQRLAAMRLPLKAEKDRVIVLEATGQVSYQRYYETLSAISAAGGIVGLISESSGGRP